MDTKLKMYEKGIQTDLEYYMIDPLKRCIFFSGFFSLLVRSSSILSSLRVPLALPSAAVYVERQHYYHHRHLHLIYLDVWKIIGWT